MFVRLRPDFSAVAAKTHVSDSAVPWRGASPSYDQVQTVSSCLCPFSPERMSALHNTSQSFHTHWSNHHTRPPLPSMFPIERSRL